MTAPVAVELVDALREPLAGLVLDAARRAPDVHHVDLRLQVTEARSAVAEQGAPRWSRDEATLSAGVRVLAGSHAVAAGHAGLALGADDTGQVPARVASALARATARARASAAGKAEARGALGPLGGSLADTRLAPSEARRDTVRAVCRLDPRGVPLAEIVTVVTDVCREVAALDARLKHTRVWATTRLARELFASSEGALIDQAFALTEGGAAVVAVSGETAEELWDVLGHQRGWEIVLEGVGDPLLAFPPLRDFALALAREALRLAAAPALPTSDGEVVVVTDPHYSALLAHEIVGHATELDRALKMEAAYAGRSWLLRGLDDHQIGRQVASPLVSAYSDPSLPGYGHHVYDHEGVPARPVVHIDRGVFTGFMNSRQTAAVLGAAPNGHYLATDAAMVPVVRMSTTVLAAGERPAADILREVDRGYYAVGHRIPSIAESREHFRISARGVYEVRNGEPGRLYRDGGLAADSRRFLMQVDAVGDDFRLYPIPNCGKGQPMQSRRLGNGGPTLRSRARVVGA